MIEESPVCIECEVTQVLELGSHDMFIAKVKNVYADEKYMDETGRFDLAKAKPLVYSHGQYYGVGRHIGRFGFSVQKKPVKRQRKSSPAEKQAAGKSKRAGRVRGREKQYLVSY